MTPAVTVTPAEVSLPERVRVLALSGMIDYTNAERLHSDLKEHLDGAAPRRLILDLTQVAFCDSAGIRTFLIVRKGVCGSGGMVTLVALNDRVRRVFSITGIIRLFDVHDSLEQALAAPLASPAPGR